jgi:hypothetical protein
MSNLNHQREENLRAIRSPASIALGVCAIAAVVLASVFYDHPLMKAPHIMASLRHHITAQ